MVKEKFFSNWKNYKNVSYGLVVTLFLLWLIFHTNQYIPSESRDSWLIVFLSYGVLSSLIFGSSDIRSKLFDTKFSDFIIRFVIFFVPCFFILSIFANSVNLTSESVFQLIQNVPVWLACVHCFVFATFESAVWQGYLDNKIGRIASPLTAGLFHYGVWSGGMFIVVISASFLFLCFSFFNFYFRANKNDLAPVIALHTAYNLIVLGI